MQLFRQTVYQALSVALVAGLVLTLLQQIGVTPLILQAEQYETNVSANLHGHSNIDISTEHQHSSAGWSPDDGSERLLYSLLSNCLAALGFALLLIVSMRVGQLSGKLPKVSASIGLLWGLCGYLIFFAAPALGLTPEIPGMSAAALEERQLWWLLCVLSTACGIGIIIFSPLRWNALGIALLIIPHLIGAPETTSPLFAHPDPRAVSALHNIHQQFIIAISLTNALYWLLLGALCCWIGARAPLSPR